MAKQLFIFPLFDHSKYSDRGAKSVVFSDIKIGLMEIVGFRLCFQDLPMDIVEFKVFYLREFMACFPILRVKD